MMVSRSVVKVVRRSPWSSHASAKVPRRFHGASPSDPATKADLQNLSNKHALDIAEIKCNHKLDLAELKAKHAADLAKVAKDIEVCGHKINANESNYASVAFAVYRYDDLKNRGEEFWEKGEEVFRKVATSFSTSGTATGTSSTPATPTDTSSAEE